MSDYHSSTTIEDSNKNHSPLIKKKAEAPLDVYGKLAFKVDICILPWVDTITYFRFRVLCFAVILAGFLMPGYGTNRPYEFLGRLQYPKKPKFFLTL